LEIKTIKVLVVDTGHKIGLLELRFALIQFLTSNDLHRISIWLCHI